MEKERQLVFLSPSPFPLHPSPFDFFPPSGVNLNINQNEKG
jgi:hypothetical protein